MKTRRLKLHRNGTGTTVPTKYPSFPARTALHQRKSKNQPHRITACDFNSVDQDILSKIFQFLDLITLCRVSCVAKSFNNIYSQNAAWKHEYYSKHGEPRSLSHENKENLNWKQLYVHTLKQAKSKKLSTFLHKILHRAKINHSLPATYKLINALNIDYDVYINDILIEHDRKKKSKQIRSFEMCSLLKIQSNESLSQFELRQIQKIQIKLKSAKFFQSIQIAFDIHLCHMSAMKHNQDIIQLYSHKNIHFAVYDECHIAFILIALNHYHLLSCIAPNTVQFDRMSYIGNDIRHKSTFYGWKLEVLCRNMKRIFFHQKFYELVPTYSDNHEQAAKMIQLKLIGDTDRDLAKLDVFPVYPWKSDTFKGRECGVFEMDIALLNDDNQPLFASSMMVSCVLITDLLNFTDQSNGHQRYLFSYNNPSSEHQVFHSITGNIVALDKERSNCNLQKLCLYLNLV